MKLGDLRSLIFEDDTPPPVKGKPDKATGVGVATTSITGAALPAEPLDSDLATGLRDKTQKAHGTEILSQVNAAADALAEFIPDPRLRCKAALKQLKGSGVTVEAIYAAYQSQLTVLDDEQKTMDSLCSEEEKALEGRKAEIDSLTTRAAQLQEAYTARKTKVQQARQRFAGAAAVVRSEIETALSQMKSRL